MTHNAAAALERLEQKWRAEAVRRSFMSGSQIFEACADELATLRARLAQQQGEAVAWVELNTTVGAGEPKNIIDWFAENIDVLPVGTKLFTHPAAVDEAFKVGDRALWTDNFGRQHRGRITVVNPVTYDFRLDDGFDAEDYPAERFALLPATSGDTP